MLSDKILQQLPKSFAGECRGAGEEDFFTEAVAHQADFGRVLPAPPESEGQKV